MKSTISWHKINLHNQKDYLKRLNEEISSFCQKYPKIKLSEETKEEMLSQGFSINEDLEFIVIVKTPYADYSFNKKTGDDYSFNKKTGELLGKSI